MRRLRYIAIGSGGIDAQSAVRLNSMRYVATKTHLNFCSELWPHIDIRGLSFGMHPSRSVRPDHSHVPHHGTEYWKKFGCGVLFASGVIAGGLAAAIPAFAETHIEFGVGVDHLTWLNQIQQGTTPSGGDRGAWIGQIQQQATAPRVDTAVKQSR